MTARPALTKLLKPAMTLLVSFENQKKARFRAFSYRAKDFSPRISFRKDAVKQAWSFQTC